MGCLDDFVDLRNIFTVPSGFGEILGSQPGQLLRDRRLPAPNQPSKLGQRFFRLRTEHTG